MTKEPTVEEMKAYLDGLVKNCQKLMKADSCDYDCALQNQAIRRLIDKYGDEEDKS